MECQGLTMGEDNPNLPKIIQINKKTELKDILIYTYLFKLDNYINQKTLTH